MSTFQVYAVVSVKVTTDADGEVTGFEDPEVASASNLHRRADRGAWDLRRQVWDYAARDVVEQGRAAIAAALYR